MFCQSIQTYFGWRDLFCKLSVLFILIPVMAVFAAPELFYF
jgi:hypothetical protein